METQEYIILSRIPWYLECKICLNLFTKPQSAPCRHTFCQSCIFDWIKQNKSPECPVCRKPLTKEAISSDLIAQYVINDFEVKCDAFCCTWKGRLEDFPKHKVECKSGSNVNPAIYAAEIDRLLATSRPINDILNEQLEKKRPDTFIAQFIERTSKSIKRTIGESSEKMKKTKKLKK